MGTWSTTRPGPSRSGTTTTRPDAPRLATECLSSCERLVFDRRWRIVPQEADVDLPKRHTGPDLDAKVSDHAHPPVGVRIAVRPVCHDDKAGLRRVTTERTRPVGQDVREDRMGIQRRRDADHVSRPVQRCEAHPVGAWVIIAQAPNEADLLVVGAIGRHQERHDHHSLDASRDQGVVRLLRGAVLRPHQVRRLRWRVLLQNRDGGLDVGVPRRRRAVGHDQHAEWLIRRRERRADG